LKNDSDEKPTGADSKIDNEQALPVV
jgi:hypothetical protein